MSGISKAGLDAATDRALAAAREKRRDPRSHEAAVFPCAADIARRLAAQFPDDLELTGRIVMATAELAATLSNGTLRVTGSRLGDGAMVTILAFAAEQLVRDAAKEAGQ